MILSAKNSCFIQYSRLCEPSRTEVVNQTTITTNFGSLTLYVIGLSHHLCWGDFYSERLYCSNGEPESPRVEPHKVYKITTKKGLIYSSIWFEQFDDNSFYLKEKRLIQQQWSISYCFGEHTALTGISFSQQEVNTVHTYPEEITIMYSKTTINNKLKY